MNYYKNTSTGVIKSHSDWVDEIADSDDYKSVSVFDDCNPHTFFESLIGEEFVFNHKSK